MLSKKTIIRLFSTTLLANLSMDVQKAVEKVEKGKGD